MNTDTPSTPEADKICQTSEAIELLREVMEVAVDSGFVTRRLFNAIVKATKWLDANAPYVREQSPIVYAVLEDGTELGKRPDTSTTHPS